MTRTPHRANPVPAKRLTTLQKLQRMPGLMHIPGDCRAMQTHTAAFQTVRRRANVRQIRWMALKAVGTRMTPPRMLPATGGRVPGIRTTARNLARAENRLQRIVGMATIPGVGGMVRVPRVRRKGLSGRVTVPV